MYRHIICIVGLILAAGCRHRAGDGPVPVVDLLREFEGAEKAPPTGFALTAHAEQDLVRPAILVPVPSRLTVPLPLPRRGVLRTWVALDAEQPGSAVRFRLGVSDHRIYEGLDELVVTGERPGWVELRTDLSAYAGFQWSLFYRPDRVTWRLVLATDLLRGPPPRGVWGTPVILAHGDSAKEYFARRERLRP